MYLLKDFAFNSGIGPAEAVFPMALSYKGPDEGLPDRPPGVLLIKSN